MDCRIELIFVPVTDVDRARGFYVDKVGFHLDIEARVAENTRFVQVTPKGSACSIAFGEGITDMTPGTQHSIQIVVADAEAARVDLVSRGSRLPRSRCCRGVLHRLHRPGRQQMGLQPSGSTTPTAGSKQLETFRSAQERPPISL